MLRRIFRIKIMQNVSVAFVKMGQYADAITSFEHIMTEEPNFRTGFNLILCYFALGDRDKMRRTFERLLTVDLKIEDEDKYQSTVGARTLFCGVAPATKRDIPLSCDTMMCLWSYQFFFVSNSRVISITSWFWRWLGMTRCARSKGRSKSFFSLPVENLTAQTFL